MLARVEEVDRGKGRIVYRKVRDLKGTWPSDIVRHVFIPNPGAKAVQPLDEKEWLYILQWAAKGKTAVLFSWEIPGAAKGCSPDSALSHAYIDQCWYSSRKAEGQDLWRAFSVESGFLRSHCCGKPAQLAAALDDMFAGKEAVVSVISDGTKEDLRQGRAKIQELRVGLKILDSKGKREYLPKK